jgi:hypothetical protein
MGKRAIVAIHPQLALAMLVLLAAAPIVLAMALVPRAAVLAALSPVAIVLGFALAGIAWWRKAARHAATVTLWDMAGACVLIGCAAAILAEPENMLQVFAESDKP